MYHGVEESGKVIISESFCEHGEVHLGTGDAMIMLGIMFAVTGIFGSYLIPGNVISFIDVELQLPEGTSSVQWMLFILGITLIVTGAGIKKREFKT